MALDFPANPTDGQIYGSYRYSSAVGAWQGIEESAPLTITSPTAPTTANPGDLWYNSSNGILFNYYSDGTSAQWVEVLSSNTLDISGKANIDSPTFSGTVTLPSTTSIGNVSSTEIGYVDGVTSAIQTQLNGKAESSHTHAATDITSGSLASARLPSGTVLQVVEFGTGANTATVSGQYSWGNTGIAATITPRSTSSRIKVTANITCSCSAAGWVFMRVLRGSTPVGNGTAGGTLNFSTLTYITDFGRIEPMNACFVDSPSTTSATTYTVQFAVYTGTGYLNRRGADSLFGSYSNIVLEEIA